MNFLKNKYNLYILSLALLCSNCGDTGNATNQNAGTVAESYYTEADFSSVKKFNTHVHISVYDSIFIRQAAADNFRFLTVNVNSPSVPVEQQQQVAVKLIKDFPQNIYFAGAFSVKDFNSAGWLNKTLDYLKKSFDSGAIAVKIWKNIGMELKDTHGKFVMIDNPVFDTIIDFIEKNNITLIGHLGEPRNAWLPVEQMTVAGDKNYFAAHPEYHMYLHPEYPSYEDQVNARDHMLEKHPRLRFVGAHLGSLEWSVDELAKRLDKFPNMAVDLAERISHLQYQAVTDWEKVHDFLIKYQDRLIYATDEGVNSTKDPVEVSRLAHENWLRHWKFFTSGERMKVPKVEKEFNGMKLPKEVVDKIYLKNAEKWFPPIVSDQYSISDFDSVRKIDTHIHLNTDETTFIEQAAADNLQFLDIVDDRPFGVPMNEQEIIAIKQVKSFPQRVEYATTFSVRDFNQDGWQTAAIDHIKSAIQNGAIGVKVWKNIGMDLKDSDGKFVMIDNPAFDTILNFLEQNKIPLIGHLGEPRECWLPLDQMVLHKGYYSEHPEYHMYLHPEFPSYEKQVQSRDNILEKHPDLIFIGAHLGSIEWSLDELAKRLDKYPNMNVDLARMSDLYLHAKNNWQNTRDFFIRYQDRLLYATDVQVGATKDAKGMNRRIHDSRIFYWSFFVSDEAFNEENIGSFRGLHLPREVVDKIYYKNAKRLFNPHFNQG